jgi:hypothetical protein
MEPRESLLKMQCSFFANGLDTESSLVFFFLSVAIPLSRSLPDRRLPTGNSGEQGSQKTPWMCRRTKEKVADVITAINPDTLLAVMNDELAPCWECTNTRGARVLLRNILCNITKYWLVLMSSIHMLICVQYLYRSVIFYSPYKYMHIHAQ